VTSGKNGEDNVVFKNLGLKR